jgi:tRNA nucleotidyltransferase (CCA-adding enzyme)
MRDSGGALLGSLRALPGGSELLQAAQPREDVELVGGAVRDLLLQRVPRELDVVVGDAAAEFADELVEILDDRFAGAGVRAETRAHERFGTAVVRWQDGRIDVARRRAEAYAAPGALPDVRVGSAEQDLQRRDFTINAIAVGLGGVRLGELRAAPYALDDLAAGHMRVQHDASFLDDPTRLLRLARYSARLGFEPEQRTARLAAEAICGGALATVSHARVGAELRLALAEPDPVAALESLRRLGVLSALHEAIGFDAPIARAALAALPPAPDAWPDVLLLAALLLPDEAYDATNYETRLRVLLDGWEIPATERERAVHSAILASRVAERLQRAQTPSQIYAVVHDVALEAVALAAALADAHGWPAAGAAARRWLDELRHVALTITGEDVLRAGVAAGPQVGKRLRHALMRKLDGELRGREDELSAALEDA